MYLKAVLLLRRLLERWHKVAEGEDIQIHESMLCCLSKHKKRRPFVHLSMSDEAADNNESPKALIRSGLAGESMINANVTRIPADFSPSRSETLWTNIGFREMVGVK